jgi:hypothetical protein
VLYRTNASQIVANAILRFTGHQPCFSLASMSPSKTKANKSIVTYVLCVFAHRNTLAVTLATVSAQLIRILHCSGDLQRHYVKTATVEFWHG